MPWVTWEMDLACASDALDISLMVPVTSCTPVTTSFKDMAVSSAIFVPFSTALRELSISAAVFLDASALLLARFLTSSATTANPFPASPALAASTAAFSARMLVWNAMSSMVLMIFPISLERSLISPMADSISCILRLLSAASFPTSLARSLAFCALSAFCFTWEDISLTVAASSSMEEACSVAPWDRAWAPSDTCSLPLATWSEDWLIWAMVLLRESDILVKAVFTLANSPA